MNKTASVLIVSIVIIVCILVCNCCSCNKAENTTAKQVAAPVTTMPTPVATIVVPTTTVEPTTTVLVATPPLIENTRVVVETNKAKVSWSTNSPTRGSVFYGRVSSYEWEEMSPYGSASFHSVTMDGLSAGTTYYYKIRVADADGNVVYSTEQSFTTDSCGSSCSGSYLYGYYTYDRYNYRNDYDYDYYDYDDRNYRSIPSRPIRRD